MEITHACPELFLVIDGTLTIQLRDGDVTLRAAVRGAAGRGALPDRGQRGAGDADRAGRRDEHR